MQLIIGKGITDVATFGMTPDELLTLHGTPNREIDLEDDDGREDWQYYDLQMTFRFYDREYERLGWIQCENPTLAIGEKAIIGAAPEEIGRFITAEGFIDVEVDDYDSFSSHYWTDASLELQHTYGRVRKVNFGVLIRNDDTYDWPNL